MTRGCAEIIVTRCEFPIEINMVERRGRGDGFSAWNGIGVRLVFGDVIVGRGLIVTPRHRMDGLRVARIIRVGDMVCGGGRGSGRFSPLRGGTRIRTRVLISPSGVLMTSVGFQLDRMAIADLTIRGGEGSIPVVRNIVTRGVHISQCRGSLMRRWMIVTVVL